MMLIVFIIIQPIRLVLILTIIRLVLMLAKAVDQLEHHLLSA